ncbi:uncharacterized protein LOC131155768 [Malania oleifera]|uniref:uncharacterized protein LOC131155768 n=1 Tax=Malania oleifera TaxID=397392 RepID=UPI0025AE47E8|nr:uncharacterized protein LOC131155768 [Malania oleifera]
MSLPSSFPCLPDQSFRFPNPGPYPCRLCFRRPHFVLTRKPRFSLAICRSYSGPNLTLRSPAGLSPATAASPKLSSAWLQLAISAVVLLGFGARSCSVASARVLASAAQCQTVQEETIQSNLNDDQNVGKLGNVEKLEDEELKAAFESWKSKTFALTVPLRIISLHGSIPPSWVKDFMQSQGKRLKLSLENRGSLEDIFSKLSVPCSKCKVDPKSVVAADLITIGDSWLNFAIERAMIEPIKGLEDQDWFRGLSDKWKVYLCRNDKGELDSEGKIWAAPYRWGSMVIAYKKSKFQKYKLAPIEDWADLWRPELAGRISMVDSPREVVGAVLKYMGASYNTKNFESQVAGGRAAVQKNLALLRKQVRLFDSVHYLKAFGVGDVWVAVGWSSDILPAAKRMSNVAVIVPKSGASLWVDLWAIPAAAKFDTSRMGGRLRGPSPLIHQWIEFCLQGARALPFKQEVIPGATPSALEHATVELPHQHTKGKPKLETNLIAGAPPPEILSKCEFLEPLSDAALSDCQWLIAGMHKPDGHGLIHGVRHSLFEMIQTIWLKLQLR